MGEHAVLDGGLDTAGDLRFLPAAAPCTVTEMPPFLPAGAVLSRPRNGAPKRTVETGSFVSLVVFCDVKVQLASIREEAVARSADREMEVVSRYVARSAGTLNWPDPSSASSPEANFLRDAQGDAGGETLCAAPETPMPSPRALGTASVFHS